MANLDHELRTCPAAEARNRTSSAETARGDFIEAPLFLTTSSQLIFTSSINQQIVNDKGRYHSSKMSALGYAFALQQSQEDVNFGSTLLHAMLNQPSPITKKDYLAMPRKRTAEKPFLHLEDVKSVR